nr:hypothetical protein [Mycobacterium liflandii]
MRPSLMAASVLVAAAALTGGCTAVNKAAGEPVGHAFQLLEYPQPVSQPVAEPAEGSPYGGYSVEVAGSVTYLKETTVLPKSGLLTIGPGPRAGELQVQHYYQGDRFPYETGVLSKDGTASTLNAITIVNPLDSRVSLQCAVAGGIALENLNEPRDLHGECGGGAKLSGTVRADGTRQATWRGKPVELARTVVDLTITGMTSGKVHQISDVPKGGSFPLYTAIDVNMTAQGINLTEELERYVLPRVQD